ncbi:MAG: hypothetical protein NTY67_14655 [Cyanobacteria bacterium]|nr:hypothetical protein [Cyanobacteriota bacterium]
MSTSLDSPLPSSYRSRQDFLASLPPWRRLLSKLNWHPTVELKVQQYELEKRLQQLRSETEQMQKEEMQREIAHEQRMQQLASDTEQLRKENAREAELNAKIAALWPSSTSSSAQAPPPEHDSPI